MSGLKSTLPWFYPTKFARCVVGLNRFAVGEKAAKQIGLTIPPNVLVRADKVIK